jgi:GxxExxY protein
MKRVSEAEERIGKQVVDIAYKIHVALGPGLLEKVYEACFCYELQQRGFGFEQQKLLPVVYGDIKVENALRIDLIIEDLVIIELKARESYHPVWEAQLLSYLKLADKKLGYLINFSVPLIKEGIKRMVL